ncbi:MAG: hypothetical protein PF448_06260 [Bacteroidales bacterium]|jgi:DNA-binding transcriptional ArsR family regulator|nr:hypothetical protein [Bacteroidales bacterium]
MSKLNTITALAKKLSSEFGETVEGAGYNMLYQMLRVEPKNSPKTLKSIRKSISNKLEEAGITNSRFRLVAEVYADSNEAKFELMLFEFETATLNSDKVSDLLKNAFEVIEEEAPEILKRRAIKANENDVTV